MDYKKILRKFFKAKTSAELPQEANGQVLYAEDENSLYIDTETSRNRINPPADWEEANADSPSYVANKPELGSVVEKDVATSLEDEEDIPTVGIVNDAIENISVWIKVLDPNPWEGIIANENYATDYEIGKLVDLDFGEFGVHQMELVAKDTDDLADGSGKARMTWICKDLITYHAMNTSASNANGWPSMPLRSWLKSTVLEGLPVILKNNIVEVNKTYYDYTSKSTKTTVDDIWIPSAREMFLNGGNWVVEGSGVDYTAWFSSAETRKKKYNENYGWWWLRTAYSGYSDYFLVNDETGSLQAAVVTRGGYICPGFCI